MSVDLNNTFKYDKIVINLNSDNCLYINNNKTNYYINLVEPLKNVIYIKILKASVTTDSAIINNSLNYKKNDPIYIAINDYDRSLSYIKSIQTTITSNYYIGSTLTNVVENKEVFDSVNYFDLIQFNDDIKSNSHNHSEISYTQTSFDWSDPSVYILNPPEQSLKRFNIQIKDKTFQLFSTSILLNFNISICVYVIKNRV
jgi:hypothetical protein